MAERVEGAGQQADEKVLISGSESGQDLIGQEPIYGIDSIVHKRISETLDKAREVGLNSSGNVIKRLPRFPRVL